jgi:Mycothiol maleylpyruvate isomerase N-terminal domain
MNTSEEEAAFVETIDTIEPTAPTRAAGWTAHDVLVHMSAGAAEIARNVSAFSEGGAASVPATRGFEEREAPYRAMSWAQLRNAFDVHRKAMAESISVAITADPSARTPWTGRQMPIAAFVSHTRSEYALHRWDMVGDDAISLDLLSRPEHTAHAVRVLAGPLVARGVAAGATGEFRFASPGLATIVVVPIALTVESEESDTAADIVSDAASRLLLLWGRMPDDPARITATSQVLAAAQTLLQGY